ncbi:SDR family NAD(P)-dependent oxidoreductase [Rathayibacter soli]|uniref:SDR family NAD(P)-dependent oxidoreductase n=1 Tax=Rathayibacter soli TaxID=3144168 RepID=UPI0027E529F1|nr:SDR family NAD(P)-dependent oxidoreductase [Glaciibacter superstes]
MSPRWNPAALPRLHGRTIVVTGANAGIGFFTSLQLAGAGAHVILACRNETRADAAIAAIHARVPSAQLEFLSLDTADLTSVSAAAARIRGLERVDVLIENAGMVHPPAERTTNGDGNELVLATNFLGHFALAAQVMPALLRTSGARIVSLGSMVTRLYDFRIGDLQLRAHYTPNRAYAHSKIAVQSFGFELDRRLRAADADVASIVAHPGYSIGGLTERIEGVNEPSGGKRAVDALLSPMAQSKSRGAWPIVRAAVDSAAVGGQYYGPRLLTEGQPVLQQPTRTSVDPEVAAELWRKAEEYTGMSFE